MARKERYLACPRCEREIEGAAIHKCVRCGAHGCLKVDATSAYGCWLEVDCPECNCMNSYRIVGVVGAPQEQE